MISRSDLDALLQREVTSGSRVLSVMLDTDQRDAVNISRGFEVEFKNRLRDLAQSLDEEQREQLAADTQPVFEFLEEYREPKRSLVVYSDHSEGFFWLKPLRAKVRNDVRWEERPYVRPLIEIFDEYERYGVVLADRQQARLFTIFLGEIEEHYQAFAELDVKHINAPGQERAWAQDKIQRKANEHAHAHFKHVAEMLSRLARIHEFDRLILAGTAEITSELWGLLPKRLQSLVVREMALQMNASDAEILEQTLKVEQEVERQHESELVEGLITAAGKRKQAVLGLNDTLMALQEYRVWRLVYTDGFSASGSQCTNCGALLARVNEPCAFCGKPVNKVNDLIGLTAARVTESGGKVELVHDPAATRLNHAGNIGAFLRY